MQAYGLYTHIRANRLRSLYLLASFVALLLAILYSLSLLMAVWIMGDASTGALFARARALFFQGAPYAILAAGLWFAVAWTFHQKMIDYATGSQDVTRAEAPKLYAALETLCISRGITMPALKIIDSDALNAFASGMQEGHYCVSVTRGLMDRLSAAELEAVLGHELTHIRNRDVQLMVVATIFAGIIGFVADIVVRNWDFPFGYSPRRSSKDDDSKGSGGAFIVILVAVAVIAVSWGLSVLIRFAISRQREFMADAGSVELTKNPDAMISALRKIEANARIPDMPSRMSAFFIESPLSTESALLSTHPSIGARVEALVRYGGGHDPGPIRVAADAEPASVAPPSPPPQAGPWGPAPPQSNA